MSYEPGKAFAAIRQTWLLAVSAFISGALMMSAAHAQSALSWLEVKPLGSNMVQITAHATAVEAISGADFSLSLRRQNGGNSSSTRQSGRFDLAPAESKVLSSTTINLEAGDDLKIELKITDHGREISSATVSSKRPSAGQTL